MWDLNCGCIIWRTQEGVNELNYKILKLIVGNVLFFKRDHMFLLMYFSHNYIMDLR